MFLCYVLISLTVQLQSRVCRDLFIHNKLINFSYSTRVMLPGTNKD